MQRQLFDKPLSELREAFVRARFAEPAMFGRADIETPRQDPRELAVWSTVMPRVGAYLEHAWDDDRARRMARARVLRQNATAYAVSFPDWYAPGRVMSLLETLRSGGGRVYFTGGEESGGVVVALRHALYVLDLPKPGGKHAVDCTLRPAAMRDVAKVLIEEIREGLPKKDEAARFLSEQIEVAIRCARQEAERDFDEAVAVGADGTKIVKASWVVVGAAEGRTKNRATLYAPEAFRVRKVLLPRHGHERFNYGTADPRSKVSSDELDGFVKAVSARNNVFGGRGMLDLRDTPHGDILFIDEALCPSPLPEGGRVIRA